MGRAGLGFMQRAACRDLDSRVFFVDNHRGIEAAKAVCRRCPVRGECLSYALENCRDDNCIYGGYTLGERETVARS
jgi:WhiB family redox-sensing transcriptional regulator